MQINVSLILKKTPYIRLKIEDMSDIESSNWKFTKFLKLIWAKLEKKFVGNQCKNSRNSPSLIFYPLLNINIYCIPVNFQVRSWSH